MRYDELSQADQERWIEMSRQTLEAKLARHPGKSLLMVLPKGINDVWTWGHQDWAMQSPHVRLHVFPLSRLDAPVNLFSRVIVHPRQVLTPLGHATFHIVPPGPVKAEEAHYLMEMFKGIVGVLPHPQRNVEQEGFLAKWGEAIRMGQPYPGGVQVPAHGEVLPYWPW
jgi:hypothetical protein